MIRIARAEAGVREDDLVIISELDHAHIHLPMLRDPENPLRLELEIERRGIPGKWVAQCGVRGGTWHWRESLFGGTRGVCLRCVRAGLAEAA